jgi:hypothetical protein
LSGHQRTADIAAFVVLRVGFRQYRFQIGQIAALNAGSNRAAIERFTGRTSRIVIACHGFSPIDEG